MEKFLTLSQIKTTTDQEAGSNSIKYDMGERFLPPGAPGARALCVKIYYNLWCTIAQKLATYKDGFQFHTLIACNAPFLARLLR